MEKDIIEAIQTAAPTNNKGNEYDIVPIELVDEKERSQDGYGDGEPVTIRFRMKYKYNKNRLPTREKDIVEAIDIAAPTNNKGNEDDIVPVELVDQEERIQDGYGDGESVTIRFRMKYKYNKIDF